VTSGTAPGPSDLASRLARYRAATRTDDGVASVVVGDASPGPTLPSRSLAERLAQTLDAEVVETSLGTVVRYDAGSQALDVDRHRLARLPGQPPADVPLVCLDTETTGLATAAGTVAFLIGVGWWEQDRFRQVQLLLPDHSEEPALLAALGALIPVDGWLVTYNGRGFDWPLLVTRHRMVRRPPPIHAGHLDLLPIVRRLFRHRLDDARLKTAETGLLGIHRHGDVDGWEIPGRYLGFLRGGPAGPLVEVVRHNDQDVRSLARLLVYLERGYATGEARSSAPAGDLAGLARAYARDGQFDDALGCYDSALLAPLTTDGRPSPSPPAATASSGSSSRAEPPWWTPGATPDFGGRRRPADRLVRPDRTAAFAVPWTTDRIAVERAHLLRRLGRWDEAATAWGALVAGSGRVAIVAAIELAKVHEHRRRDHETALAMAISGLALVERRRALGRPEPGLEADLHRRATRLRRRLEARRSRVAIGDATGGGGVSADRRISSSVRRGPDGARPAAQPPAAPLA
jgi:hypothetical protein